MTMIDLNGAGPWLVLASVLMFALSLIALPLVIIYLPHDYFSSKTPRFAHLQNNRPLVRWLLLILKNAIGGLLIAAGLIMLVTPGQGMLAMFVGLMLLDVPGKRWLERRILQHPSLLPLINRIRAKAGRPPLDGGEMPNDE